MNSKAEIMIEKELSGVTDELMKRIRMLSESEKKDLLVFLDGVVFAQNLINNAEAV